MNDKIAQYVRETMKGYGVSDRKLERELILACRDEYEMRLADGAYEDEAFKAAVENIEEIAKSRIPRRNKFAFALGMGILALCISVLEMLASLLVARLDVYRASMPVCIASIVVIIVLYVILKRGSYRWYDFLILGVMLASWIASTILLLPDFLFNYTPGSDHELNFVFPCLFESRIHRDWMGEGVWSASYSFYPNFLVSLCIFLPALILFLREKLRLSAKDRRAYLQGKFVLREKILSER